MPFEIVRKDITKTAVDTIVNTADPRAVVSWGRTAITYRHAPYSILQIT